SFSVKDVSNTENYVLAYDVATSFGRLLVSLNGENVFDGIVPQGNAEPIVLNQNKILDQNSLYLEATGVGLAFWKLNEYELKNVRVIADFTDVSKREYKNFFIVSATEKENFDNTKLVFVPDCLTNRVGPLSITINGRMLNYQGIPDCGLLSTIEFDPAILQQGENVITFKADEGNYFIDRVAVKSELKELNYPFYYFELKDDVMKKVSNNTANVSLELVFADREDKTGEIIVNGHVSRLSTENASYTKVLNPFVQEGQNSLQIRPITTMNIVDLKVTLHNR
ncbi:MAG TPA: hypothetical protein VKE88_03095, partial [Candidatus Nanoarchaeia archaeon]|nr:hypothetical protein [Candidatus Nanoarchaeia archaeon]